VTYSGSIFRFRATLPRTERGRPIVLGEDPKGKNFLYCHANSVIVRDLAHPEISDIYTQHSCQVNVAKYSPSGFYIASADKSGKVRIWDTINKEHILKSEYQPISGPIHDLSWSQDNQRIVVVGEGINFMNTQFGQNFCGQFFICKFWTNLSANFGQIFICKFLTNFHLHILGQISIRKQQI
jgi:WD40 repeat protein